MINKILTEAEDEVITLLGQAWNLFIQQVVGDEDTADADKVEFLAHIHNAQRMIMSNAAGRAMPDEYRMLGRNVGSRE